MCAALSSIFRLPPVRSKSRSRMCRSPREAAELTRQKLEAGVSTTVDYTQAQESATSAQFDYINAVFAHNIAKLSLARAMGRAAKSLPEFLKLPQAPGQDR